MADTPEKSVLEAAVEAHRETLGPEQKTLFSEPQDGAVELPPARGKGRPAGSRNLRSEAYAALLMREHGDPLVIATRIAARNVLDPDVVRELAQLWGCGRFDAVKLWAQISRDVQPYLHQTLPRAVILNPGDPRGERVLLELDGDYTDVTPGPHDDGVGVDGEEDAR